MVTSMILEQNWPKLQKIALVEKIRPIGSPCHNTHLSVIATINYEKRSNEKSVKRNLNNLLKKIL
jgi:hypothetical protein